MVRQLHNLTHRQIRHSDRPIECPAVIICAGHWSGDRHNGDIRRRKANGLTAAPSRRQTAEPQRAAGDVLGVSEGPDRVSLSSRFSLEKAPGFLGAEFSDIRVLELPGTIEKAGDTAGLPVIAGGGDPLARGLGRHPASLITANRETPSKHCRTLVTGPLDAYRSGRWRP